MTTQTAQPKADKKMATAKVAPAKQQDKAAKMLPAAGESQVNAISQTALALSMIALGVIAFFTRRRKTN
ncbi:LPXTG cell wall anchor domain-containing protein [Staphylococcus pseudintermedius]|uniref:LPXTG cell wall anchor domain-containing protein n=1 Tax=Staphylococcus pseudintermedius TaxID=283734 RepID=UPI001F54BC2A|nr:LPXTG cell wall anchor domain-containing protein [Staphylococcus pseudintermedius]